MINIDKFKTFLFFVANKSGKGTITPSQFNLLAEQSLTAWTNKQIGDVDQTNPRTSLDLDQVAQEKLRHLKEHRNFRVNNGILLTPDGSTVVDINTEVAPAYWFFSALTHRLSYNDTDGQLISYHKEINIVKDGEFALRSSSQIKPPTHKHPISVLRAKDFEIAPLSINIVKLVYLRHPNTPAWAYTIVNKRPVYDSNSSTDIDAPQSALNELTMIACEYLGIHIREQQLIQFAAMQENTAQ